jgi:hypothetical protein
MCASTLHVCVACNGALFPGLFSRRAQDGFAVGYATKAITEREAAAASRGLPPRPSESNGLNREARRKATGIKGKSKGAPKAMANTTPQTPPPSGE